MRIFAADFETTVYRNQTSTEVWSAAICEVFGSEEVAIFHSLPDFLFYLEELKQPLKIYFHNLKFDGSFILDYLLRNNEWKCGIESIGNNYIRKGRGKLSRREYLYTISDRGQWYGITLKTKYNKKIEIYDSWKLLPFSLRRAAKAFKTKHQKLDMEYEGNRFAGCEISEEELEYIKNDVLVLKELLEYMFNAGHTKMTIGSCCLDEFKKLYDKTDYANMSPNLYQIPISEDLYAQDNAGDYIRKSYKGAWCYLVKGKENKVYHNGTTADVNSLYPSMMHSSSGNIYPIGLPQFWYGDYIPEQAIGPNKYYFVRIRTSFKIKEGMLPTIQIKGTLLYMPTEFLERSAVYIDGEYYEYKKTNGKIEPVTVELTLTMTDLELIKEHYKLYNFEILSGCWFYAEAGIYDRYIDKYMEIKMNSKGAEREEAKLFLNNLYGKEATSEDSSFKVAYLDGEKVKFTLQEEKGKAPGYIARGSAITSYARRFTIKAAQLNFNGKDKAGFIYADTDSIHCDLPPEEIKGITVHPTQMSCWKLESNWDKGLYVRQKTYMEHIVMQDGKPVSSPYYDIKCAGLPDNCKRLLDICMGARDFTKASYKKLTKEERRFICEPKSMEDFKVGIKIPGKLKPHRIKGGIVLIKEDYIMRKTY